MKYGEEARRENHDRMQASRRSTAQNLALIELLNSIKPVEGQIWDIGDVPPEGGVLEVSNVLMRRLWTIQRDGIVTSSDV